MKYSIILLENKSSRILAVSSEDPHQSAQISPGETAIAHNKYASTQSAIDLRFLHYISWQIKKLDIFC